MTPVDRSDGREAGIQAAQGLAEMWDAVVVGAGPAGAVLAHQLARAGASVLIVDKARFPRFKACGCCINSAAAAALEEIGLGELPLRCGGIAIDSFDLRMSGWPGSSARMPLKRGYALSRSIFDASLSQAATTAGAHFEPETTATLGSAQGACREVHLRRQNGSCTVKARMVIAADGLAGTFLRDEPTFQPRVHRRSYIGAAVTLASDNTSSEFGPGVIWMMCGSGGYVGAVRLDGGMLHLAAALDPRLVKACGGPGEAAARLLHAAKRPVPPGIADVRWRGTPTLTRSRQVEGDGVLVIGDAAGYVEPFTGEGMAWAISSGIAAAPIVLRGVQGDEVRGEWTKRHAALVGSRQRICRAVATGLRWHMLAGCAVRVASLVPALGRPVLGAIERPADVCARDTRAIA